MSPTSTRRARPDNAEQQMTTCKLTPNSRIKRRRRSGIPGILLPLLLALLAMPVSISSVYAEIRMTAELAREVRQTYGFYIGQRLMLDRIRERYPSLSLQALGAEREFDVAFQSSVKRIEQVLTQRYGPQAMEEMTAKLIRRLTDRAANEELSPTLAQQFIDQLYGRAKGHMPSPFVETFLLYKPGYDTHPEREFIEGYKQSYSSQGHAKAKGVHVVIEAPRTWAAQEAKRPNIVQKFVNENGRGYASVQILVYDLPILPHESITEADVDAVLNPVDILDFVPDNATYIDSGKLSLEGLLGLWVRYDMEFTRVRSSIGMESIMYMIYYRNKVIGIHGAVGTSIDEQSLEQGGFEKFQATFDLVANSLMLPDRYR